MKTEVPPVCRIIAGPNGAGKTMFALTYLPEVARCRAFVNADLIAAGLSPLAPEQRLMAASRLFLGEVGQHIRERRDFAFETTLAGRGYLRLRADGWRVELIYLALPTMEMSMLRVAARVAHGGHSIPQADIGRRFPRSLHNLFEVYSGAVDDTRCFLNSSETPQLVFVQRGGVRSILHATVFEQLLSEAEK
jgi:predicted ABC-type ATPase